VASLLDQSARTPLSVWNARGRCLNGVRMIRHGEVGDGLEVLRTALDELQETGFVPYFTALLGTLAQGLGEVGQVAEGLATIDEALARSERDEELWCIAELLRLKAELLVRQGRTRPTRLRSISSAPWTGRAGKGSSRWSCVARSASRNRGRGGDEPVPRASCWARFTLGSPRGSGRPSYRPRNGCSTTWARSAVVQYGRSATARGGAP
jgi:hypothetical protein